MTTIVSRTSGITSGPEVAPPSAVASAATITSSHRHRHRLVVIVRDAMPFVADSQDFQMAWNRCPTVVDSESPIERFVEHCNGNVWEAASRLAKYWSLRVQVFGKDRAFRPLQEALTDDDKTYLARGVMAATCSASIGSHAYCDIDAGTNITTTTSFNSSQNDVVVFCTDEFRVPDPLPPLTVRLAALFAAFQILSETTTTTAACCDRNHQQHQQHADNHHGGASVSSTNNNNHNNKQVVMVRRMDLNRMGQFAKVEIELVRSLLRDSMCIRLKRVHVLVQTTSETPSFLQRNVLPVHLGPDGTSLWSSTKRVLDGSHGKSGSEFAESVEIRQFSRCGKAPNGLRRHVVF